MQPDVWVTVKVCPAMVIVPLRAGPTAAFEATLKLTVPLPLPFAPPVIVIQTALLTAVQVQPLPAVTFTLLLPPMTPKFWLVAPSEYVQLEA